MGWPMKKTFDCVEMKSRVQADLLKRMEGMSDEEARHFREDLIASDSLLARLRAQSRPVGPEPAPAKERTA